MKPLFLRFSAWFIAVAVIAFLPSCVHAQDYRRVIPAEAKSVVSIDLARVVDLTGDKFDLLIQSINKTDSTAAERIKWIAENPEQTGVDFASPVYLFFTADSGFGLTARVNDAQKLSGVLSMAAASDGAEVKRGSVGEVSFFGKGNCILAFDATTALILGKSGESAPFDMAKVAQFFEDKSYTPSAGMKAMCERKGEVKVFADVSAMQDDHLPVPLKAYYTAMPKEGSVLIGSMESSAGRCVLNWDLVALTPEAEAFAARQAENLMAIKGVYADRIPDTAMITYYLSLNGGKLAEMLDELGMLTNATDADNELVKKVVASLDGDVVAYIDKFNVGQDGNISMNIPLILMAQVKDASSLELFASAFGKADGVKKIKDGYVIGNGENKMYVTVVKNNLMFASSEMVSGGKVKPAVQPLDPTKYKGSYGYFNLSVQQILANLGSLFSMFDATGSVTSIADRVHGVECVLKSAHETVGTINFADNSDNLYKFIADLVAMQSVTSNLNDEPEVAGEGEEVSLEAAQ